MDSHLGTPQNAQFLLRQPHSFLPCPLQSFQHEIYTYFFYKIYISKTYQHFHRYEGYIWTATLSLWTMMLTVLPKSICQTYSVCDEGAP